MGDKEIKLNFNWLKKVNWIPILLVAFLILGLFLRTYHLNFPSIGYHNMKENEYLDEAYFFLNEGNFLHKQTFIFQGLNEETTYHDEYAQVPLVAYAAAAGWG